LLVHGLEGSGAIFRVQGGPDPRVERAEHRVPHLDHWVRRRGHDQVDALVRDPLKKAGIVEQDLVKCLLRNVREWAVVSLHFLASWLAGSLYGTAKNFTQTGEGTLTTSPVALSRPESAS